MPTLDTVLDLAYLEALSSEAIAEAIIPALAACGAAYIVGHGIPAALIDDVLSISGRLHRLSDDVKARHDVSRSDGARGFFSVDSSAATVRRNYCSFEIGNDCRLSSEDAEEAVLFAGCVWPGDVGGRETIEEYLAGLRNLTIRLCLLMARALDLDEQYFAVRMRNPVYHLRLMEYGGDESLLVHHGALTLGEHTDYECFTFVVESTPGLQVADREGNWLDVAVRRGALVMLLGDLMEAISGRALESVLHRVSIGGAKRNSAVFFAGLDPDAKIAGCESGEPLRVGDHLLARTLENFPHLRSKVEQGLIGAPRGFGKGNPFKKAKVARLKGRAR